jgi:hypothetical protein
MGLGKTVQSCSMLNYLYHEQQQYGPFIVIVPLSTLPAWQSQLATWAPDLNVIAYVGTGPSRAMIREYEFGSVKKLKFNVLLTTYEFALKDQADLGAIKWQYLMVDEVRLPFRLLSRSLFPSLFHNTLTNVFLPKYRLIALRTPNRHYTKLSQDSTPLRSFSSPAPRFRTTLRSFSRSCTSSTPNASNWQANST